MLLKLSYIRKFNNNERICTILYVYNELLCYREEDKKN